MKIPGRFYVELASTKRKKLPLQFGGILKNKLKPIFIRGIDPNVYRLYRRKAFG